MPADAIPAHTSAAERIKDFEEDVVETALKLIGAADKQGDSATATRLKTLAFRRFPDPRLQP